MRGTVARLALALLWFACTPPGSSGPAPPASPSSVLIGLEGCPLTPASTGKPSSPHTASFSREWFGSSDGKLWASKPPRYYEGDNKVLWERPGDSLEVLGHPLGTSEPSVRASIPGGYTGFTYQASGISFPVPGCWEITARAGDSVLRFVVYVHPVRYRPATGRCANLKDLVDDDPIVTAEIETVSEEIPGLVRVTASAMQVWKGGLRPKSTFAFLQDATQEKLVGRGERYVLFLRANESGILWIHCAHFTLWRIEGEIQNLDSARLVRPEEYARYEAFWSARTVGALKAELEGAR